MAYLIKKTATFSKRLDNLRKYFDLSDSEITDVLDDIEFSIRELALHGKLPHQYDDHVLTDAPWTGFNEYHILDNLLVVYYRVEKNHTIRLTTILTHQELRSGKM